MLKLYNILYIADTERITMLKNQTKIKNFLRKLSKYVFYSISAVIILVIFIIVALQIFSFYEKSKFINNCLAEGYSQEHCQSVWGEIDALN